MIPPHVPLRRVSYRGAYMWVRVRVWVRMWVWVGGGHVAHCALIDIVAVFSSHQPLVARVVRHYLARCFSPIVSKRNQRAEVGKQAWHLARFWQDRQGEK